MPQQRLHVVNILEEGAIGGPQRRSIAVAAELNRRAGVDGADTTLLFPSSADALRGECDRNNVAAAQLPIATLSRKRQAALRYGATFLPQVLRVAAWLRKSDVDVVHVSGGSFCLKGPIAAWLARVPYIWHLNDTKSDPKVRRAFQLIARTFRPARLIFAAHAVQRSYADWLPDGVPGSVVQAPHRPDLLEMEDRHGPDPFPKAPGLRILMLANINTVKGLDDAIACMAKITCEATLFIAGGVKDTQLEYQQTLKDLVSDQDLSVVFLGHCSDVGPYLAHADLSLCASLAEASPLSVWEAAAAGRAVVSTDVGDVARELPDGQAALVVPVGDIAAMAAAIDRLAGDRALRQDLGSAARKRMEQVTSIEQVATLSLGSYQAAAASRDLGQVIE